MPARCCLSLRKDKLDRGHDFLWPIRWTRNGDVSHGRGVFKRGGSPTTFSKPSPVEGHQGQPQPTGADRSLSEPTRHYKELPQPTTAHHSLGEPCTTRANHRAYLTLPLYIGTKPYQSVQGLTQPTRAIGAYRDIVRADEILPKRNGANRSPQEPTATGAYKSIPENTRTYQSLRQPTRAYQSLVLGEPTTAYQRRPEPKSYHRVQELTRAYKKQTQPTRAQ